MKHHRAMATKHIADSKREGRPVDIYKVVSDLQSEFPNVAYVTLVTIVSEEVLEAGYDAFWDRRK